SPKWRRAARSRRVLAGRLDALGGERRQERPAARRARARRAPTEGAGAPRRRGRACRDDAVGELVLELAATRREHPEAGRGGRAPGLTEEPRLPHAGPRLDDESADAAAGVRGGEDAPVLRPLRLGSDGLLGLLALPASPRPAASRRLLREHDRLRLGGLGLHLGGLDRLAPPEPPVRLGLRLRLRD